MVISQSLTKVDRFFWEILTALCLIISWLETLQFWFFSKSWGKWKEIFDSNNRRMRHCSLASAFRSFICVAFFCKYVSKNICWCKCASLVVYIVRVSISVSVYLCTREHLFAYFFRFVMEMNNA